MNKKTSGGLITAIDIGTTKIVAVIAQKNTRGIIDVVGIGQHPSHGLKKGVIVNINATVDSIKAAVQEAQSMAGTRIESACVGISGGHIKSINSTGVVAIKGREVSQHDIDRVIEAAKAIPIPKDQYILHILPQYFRVDGQEYVFDSLGMYGVRLESQVHIVTGAVASAQNIIKSCELAGLRVSDIVLEQLASAAAVLTPSEQEMGVGILDIGGGTSDFAIYKDARIRHSKVIPIAGNHFTNDLAVGLHIPFSKAEELKKLYGSVSQSKILELKKNYLDISLGYEGGTKTIELSSLAEIIHFRAEEVFDLFLEEINQFRLRPLMPTGLVITGGGSLLAGMQELASEKLGMAVRIGQPEALAADIPYAIPDILKSPIYATVYGLIIHASGGCNFGDISATSDAVFARVLKRMRSWVYDLF
ncbi:MAG: cell division protein FtsA [Candidatus Babeliales bacterium]|jgi:cell division protein FtsA